MGKRINSMGGKYPEQGTERLLRLIVDDCSVPDIDDTGLLYRIRRLMPVQTR
jgi:hypothetical protein